MSRLPPKSHVIRRLFALSGNVCAFPGCKHKLVNEKGKFIAQVCHIEAAEEGGERYNNDQTDEQRRAFDNLMLMCYEHHIETNDVLLYTPIILKKIKLEHERKYVDQYSLPEEISNDVILSINIQLQAIHDVLSENTNLTKEGNDIGKENRQAIEQLKNMVEQLGKGQVANFDESSLHSEQLEFIRTLHRSGKTETALDVGVNFKDGRWDSLSDELKFKLIVNIASMLFDLGRQEEAARYLLELENINYEKGETQAYVALAYSILKDREKFENAFQKAIAINNRSINLWIAFIHIQDEGEQPSAVKLKIPIEMLENSQVLFALGNFYLEHNLIEEGLDLLDASIKKIDSGDITNWHVQSVYASKILISVITIEKVVFKKFTGEDIRRIQHAIDILTNSWNEVRDTELAKSCWHMLMNRGTAYKAIDENTKAENDLTEALRLSDKFEPLKNLILLYIETNRINRALELLSEKSSNNFCDEEGFEFIALKARVFTLQGDARKAADMLIEQIEHHTGEPRLRILDLITIIYFESQAYENAIPFAKQLIDEFPGWSNGYLAYAICLARGNDSKLALEQLDKALTRVDKSSHKKLTLFQIGSEYQSHNAYEEAAKVFLSIVDLNAYDTTFKNLIICQYNSGDLEECIKFCLIAKSLNSEDSTIIEILFRSYKELGRYEDAEQILNEQLSSSNTELSDHFRLLGILLFKKLGEKEKVLNLASNIVEVKNLTLSQRMGIARILLDSDRVEYGLEVAYNARADYYEQGDSHASFIQAIAIRRSKLEDNSDPEKVEVDTAFVLEDIGGVSNTFFLTDDRRLSGAGVIRSTDSLSSKVLGKSIGETIEMGNSVGVGNKLTIRAILDKYSYAFKDSQYLLETRYADESGFIFFKSDNSTSIQEFIRSQSIKANAQREELFRLYSNDMATVGMLAEYLGKTQVDIWMEFITSSTSSILCYKQNESNEFNSVISDKKPIVVDCISLLTIFLLFKKPKLLINTKSELIVANSTLEEMIAYKENLYQIGAGFSIGVENGILKKFERTQKSIDKQIEDIDSIIAWCRNNCVVTTPKRVRKAIVETEDLADMIGTSSFDSLLLASQKDGVLLSDDEKLKSAGLGIYNLHAFSSYHLAIFNTQSEFISSSEFKDLYRILIRANYRYIPITAIDLWSFFDENSYKIEGSFINAVQGLRIMGIDHIASIIVVFAKSIYLNLSTPSLRVLVLSFVLNTIKKHRDYTRIVSMMSISSVHQFRLIPQYRKELMQLANSI